MIINELAPCVCVHQFGFFFVSPPAYLHGNNRRWERKRVENVANFKSIFPSVPITHNLYARQLSGEKQPVLQHMTVHWMSTRNQELALCVPPLFSRAFPRFILIQVNHMIEFDDFFLCLMYVAWVGGVRAVIKPKLITHKNHCYSITGWQEKTLFQLRAHTLKHHVNWFNVNVINYTYSR